MRQDNKSKSVVVLAAAAASLLMVNPSARGANYAWQVLSGGNASGSWATPTNWNPNLPGPTTAADTALFNAQDVSGVSTVTLDAAQTIGNITFGDTNPATLG